MTNEPKSDDRCALCGFPLGDKPTDCQRGACSFRPIPPEHLHYDAPRARREALLPASATSIGAFKAAEQLVRKDSVMTIRLNSQRKAIYAAAAKEAGFEDLSPWVLSLCDSAVEANATKKEEI